VIHAEKAKFPITMMCRLLKVSRSTYYQWAGRAGATATAARRAAVTERVIEVFHDKRQTYGCRRIAWVLNNELDTPCSVGLVADIMHEQGLCAVQPRAYKVTTVAGETDDLPPDLLGRDFTAEAPGQRLVGDITYLRTGEGWLYLATVIDLFTRMVVGWQMAPHMRTALVTDALEMARLHGHIGDGAIFHSDRGTQYTSREFDRYCVTNRITPSVGRTGICFDNAAAESFFATLKNEMYHRYRFPTRQRARFAVAEYIEVFYNRQRHHSTLGYRIPAEVLTAHQTTAATAA
jgi:putative transposase